MCEDASQVCVDVKGTGRNQRFCPLLSLHQLAEATWLYENLHTDRQSAKATDKSEIIYRD